MTTSFTQFIQLCLAQFPSFFTEADDYEQIGIALCLVQIIEPELFDSQDYTLAGIRGTQHTGLIATGQTWLQLCCGNDSQKRIDFVNNLPQYLNHPQALLSLEPAPPSEPFLAGRLVLSTYFKKEFPGQPLTYEQRLSDLKLGSFIQTKLNFTDLILDNTILEAVDEIKQWQYFLDQTAPTNSQFYKRIPMGLKVLFYGKPGTGKTQTAGILANELKKRIFRIDLSQIVSKYIGETEKNLAKIFDLAQNRNWILFFDEADALFGKRTSVSSSHDRYANQEVSYLLQRLEDYPGIVILSSNFKDNIDTAFLRRFQIIVEFNLPDYAQRKAIWQKLLDELQYKKLIINHEDWDYLCRTELSGANITNILTYAYLKAQYYKNTMDITLIKEGIVRELRKENRLTSL